MRLALCCLSMLWLSNAEVLTAKYRAVTLDPGQRRQFRAPLLHRVTAASGQCIEEGMDTDEPEAFWLEGTCGGVRTTLVWLTDGNRLHVMACAEEASRKPAQVNLRKRVQQDLKAWPSVTACVRNNRVELWGWVATEADKKRVTALEARYGADAVKSHVDLIAPDEGE